MSKLISCKKISTSRRDLGERWFVSNRYTGVRAAQTKNEACFCPLPLLFKSKQPHFYKGALLVIFQSFVRN